MKEICYPTWIDSIPVNSGLFSQTQILAREQLKTNGIPKKSFEAWRLTNSALLTEFIKHPLCSNNQKLKLNNIADSRKSSVKLSFNSEGRFEANIGKGIEKLNEKEINLYLSENSTSRNNNYDFNKTINEASNNQLIGFRVKGKEKKSLEIDIQASLNELIPTRLIIIVEEGSNIDILQIIEGSKSVSHSHIIEIHVGDSATVKHGIVSIGKDSSKLLASIFVKQKKHSSYSLSCIQKGWSMSRFEKEIVQLYGNAKTTLQGLQIAKQKQELATHSLVKFNGPNGYLEQIQKSILDDESHSIFQGMIEVPKIAQKTEASQLSKNLLLSSKAKVDTSPQLKIIADDVKCNHGATISQLSNEEIFYLQSRGINTKQANELLINAFCNDIINNVPIEVNQSACQTHLANLTEK